jgi:hypothetical protein
MSDMNTERTEADFAEQDQDAIPGADEENGPGQEEVPFEADPADAAEQGREVSSDEDEYR